jgi:hypothetical protein
VTCYVVCDCTSGHPPHLFTAMEHGLCHHCGHGVGAHKASNRESAEIADRVTRLLRTHEVQGFTVTSFRDNGDLDLSLSLRALRTPAS